MRKLLTAMAAVMLLTAGVLAFDDTFSYQARVFAPPGSGTPIPDSGTNVVDVYIYNVPTGGTALWSTTLNNVQSRNGFINVEVSGFGSALNFKDQYWLGVRVNNDAAGEMMPRHKLTAAPYAGRAVWTENIDSNTKGTGPITITGNAGTDEAVLSVTSGAGTAISAVTLDGNNAAAVSGMNKSFQPQTAGVYGYAEAGLGVYGVSTGTASAGVQGENTKGVGVSGRGVTGVAAVSENGYGIGLYARSDWTGVPIYAEGGKHSVFKSGVLVDSLASPAALWVSFTAGAWPAMKIDAPNAQALRIFGQNGGMGQAALQVETNPVAGVATGIYSLGRGNEFGLGYGVSATAEGGTGVMGIGVTGVVAAASDYWNDTAFYAHGKSFMYGGVTILASSGADPVYPALHAFNNAGTSQAIRGDNPPGTAVMGVGSTGVSGQGFNVGTEGVTSNPGGTGVLARNEYATGNDGGAALYLAGKIKASGGIVAGSPVGSAMIPAGSTNPFITVPNNLCNGTYHVFITPTNDWRDGAGQPITYWVDKSTAGQFTVRTNSNGNNVMTSIGFSYLIVNE